MDRVPPAPSLALAAWVGPALAPGKPDEDEGPPAGEGSPAGESPPEPLHAVLVDDAEDAKRRLEELKLHWDGSQSFEGEER